MTNKNMKTLTLAVTLYLGVGCLVGCASNSKPVEKTGTATPISTVNTPAGTNVLNSEKARFSYALGMLYGHNFQSREMEVDTDLLVRGIKDIQSGGSTLLTPKEMRETLDAYQKILIAKQEKARAEAAEKAKEAGEKAQKEGEAFLAQNKTNPALSPSRMASNIRLSPMAAA